MGWWIRTSLRFLVVTVGIVILTSFTIDATDTFRGSQTALSSLADSWLTEECRNGTVAVSYADATWCVDRFPATPSLDCPQQVPRVPVHTAENLDDPACIPDVREDVLPWTNVARHQAEQLCARAEKELLPGSVWYRAALGTAYSACHVTGNAPRVNSESACRSGVGAFDMVGNVWELVQDTADQQIVTDDTLPATGYVSSVDTNGWPRRSTSSAQIQYGSDRVWSRPEGEAAVMRGGFYGSGTDAGIYAVHADIALDFSSGAISFRCGYQL